MQRCDEAFEFKYVRPHGSVRFLLDSDGRTAYVDIQDYVQLAGIAIEFFDAIFLDLSPKQVRVECSGEPYEILADALMDSRYFCVGRRVWDGQWQAYVFRKPKILLYPQVKLTIEGLSNASREVSVSVVEHRGHYAMFFSPPFQNMPLISGAFIRIRDDSTGVALADELYYKCKYMSSLATRPARIRYAVVGIQLMSIMHHVKVDKIRLRRANQDVWDTMSRMCKYIMFRHNRSARKIQTAWRRCVTDPSYRVCRARLLREFAELGTL